MRTVRSRTTLGATLVVAIALVGASLLLTTFLRRSLTDSVHTAALGRAKELAKVVTQPSWDGQLSIRDDDVIAQVLDRGVVIASTSNARDEPLDDVQPGDPRVLDVVFDDDPFLAVAVPVDGFPERAVVVGHNTDRVVEAIRALVTALLVGVPLLIALVASIVWSVVGRSLRPVESIRAHVESMSAEDLSKRVPVPGTGDEIASLATTMNRMLARLQHGDERRRRFVSDASHELRSPLSTIRQHAEVALEHPGTTSLQELAETVLGENLRLQRVVDDLLLLAQMDEEASGSIRAPIDLDDVVFATITRLRPRRELEVDVTEVSACRILGNGKQLERMIGNILENAWRYAHERVKVSLSHSDESVVLGVDDDGPGVSESDRPRVFERFERLDEARDREAGGAGLGLAIVAEVARAHRGDAFVTGSALGGARFEVVLPSSTTETSEGWS